MVIEESRGGLLNARHPALFEKVFLLVAVFGLKLRMICIRKDIVFGSSGLGLNFRKYLA